MAAMLRAKPTVLHILHPWGGGTDKHVVELGALLDSTTNSLIMMPTDGGKLWIRSAAPQGLQLNFKIPVEQAATALAKLNLSLIHIHQLIGHSTNFEPLIDELGIPFYVTAHDYTLVCPQINFVNSQGKHCNESTDVTTCNGCLTAGNQFGTRDIVRWRTAFAWIFNKAAKVICPSIDTMLRLKKYHPTANYVVAAHERIADTPVTVPDIKPGDTLRVALLGKVTYIKGNTVVEQLVKLAREHSATLHITAIGQIVGAVAIKPDEYFAQTGAYDDANLLEIIDGVNPHVILFSAICPETYSYTLSAAMQSQRPIVIPDFGAFPERLSGRAWTWVFNHTDPVEHLFDKLNEIREKNFYKQLPPAITTFDSSEKASIDFYATGYLANIENRTMEKNTVIVTSALYTNYGVYDTKERIVQTLETIQSVRKYIPNAVIILTDNSKVDIQNDDSDEFNELIDAVDYYIDNSDDSDMQHFHNNVTNYDIGKNMMESLGMFKTLNYITTDVELMQIIAASTRIFKISGRYQITKNFDIAAFANETTVDKYVFKRRAASWILQENTGVDHLLQTRLWSFTPSLFELTIQLYKQLIENMLSTVKQNKYIDVEHSMAKFIPKNKLVELDQVGVSGNIAPNGVQIED